MNAIKRSFMAGYEAGLRSKSASNIVSVNVTFGMECDPDEMRSRCRYILGDEYDDSMTDEECIECCIKDEYSQGLGCEVRFL